MLESVGRWMAGISPHAQVYAQGFFEKPADRQRPFGISNKIVLKINIQDSCVKWG